MHTNSRDEALSLPTEDSVQIALRTQQIIAHETAVSDTIDPMAGSYFVEALTKEMLPVVVQAVKAAMKRNTASGDSFDVAVISSQGYRELSDEEKKSVIAVA